MGPKANNVSSFCSSLFRVRFWIGFIIQGKPIRTNTEQFPNFGLSHQSGGCSFPAGPWQPPYHHQGEMLASRGSTGKPAGQQHPCLRGCLSPPQFPPTPRKQAIIPALVYHLSQYFPCLDCVKISKWIGEAQHAMEINSHQKRFP